MASLKMRINKSGKRVFEIRVMVNGEMYRCSYPGKNDDPIPDTWSDKRALTEATKAANRFEEDCKHGAVTNDKRTLSQYAKYVIDLKEANGALKPSTTERYRGLMQRIDNAKIGSMKIRDIGIKDLNAFYVELAENGQNLNTGKTLSPKTITEYHRLISSVLHYAAKEGIIINNPALNATLPKVERKEVNYYTPEKMAQIVEAIQNEPVFWQAMTYLFIGTGARRGEIIGLQWSDIDFTNNIIQINRNITRANGQLIIGSTKTGERRNVSIAPEFLEPLKLWRTKQAENFGVISLTGFCFARENPNDPIKPDSITRYYARLGDRYHLGHINPHAFRHSQASILLQDGDIVTAAKRLGHAKPTTTLNIYGHMMPQTDKEAAARVSAAFLKNTK